MMDGNSAAETPALEADILSGGAGIRHAFFTRAGGVSGGLYESLNCGLGSRDDPAAVAENRRRAAHRVGVAADRLVTAYQVHGTEVATIDRPWPPGQRPKIDGLVTRTAGIGLGVLSADCAPVLLSDAEVRVIGVCHAGWRGALAGVTDSTIEAMTALGARREHIRAAVGPCIAQPSYEVGAEFRDRFVAADPANAAFFAAAARPGHFRFDLPGYVVDRLRRARLGTVGHIAFDTCAEDGQLFSYRRATLRGEADFGRGLSAIALV